MTGALTAAQLRDLAAIVRRARDDARTEDAVVALDAVALELDVTADRREAAALRDPPAVL